MRPMIGCLVASGLLLAGTALAQETGTIEREGLGFIERIDKTVPVGKAGTLRLSAPKGGIEVRSWDKDEVRVEVDKEAEAFTESSARKLLDRAQVFVETSGKDVQVRVEGGDDLDWDDVELEFHLSVPQVYNLDLQTSGGGISIGDLEGQVLAKTAGGGIEVGQIKNGKVDVETAGGGIEVAGIQGGDCLAKTAGGGIDIGEVSGSVNAQTAGGGIDIKKAGGEVRAMTAGGGIDIGEGGIKVYAETAGGGIDIGPVQGSVEARTAGGGIDIGPAGGDVRAQTAGGGIRIGESQGTVDAETAGGGITVEGSGGPVRVHTSGGGIEITKARGFIEAETAGGGIEAELALTDMAADAHCTLRTAGGNLTLYLPAALPATIDAQLRIERKVGRDYRIYSDFPITIQGEGTKLLTGKGEVNGGGNPIRLETTNGDIFIKKGAK
ncbi:MAG: hypothetical protein HYW07_21800 [Candidatus Latescibacteria bacterium]|nr:hypothetical protein [Candidatus Latescibacterota bacterium]